MTSKTVGQNNLAEVLTGVAVLLALLAVIGIGYLRQGAAAAGEGYEITAKLAKVDGLGVGTDVRISGIKVGNISALALDPQNFMVTVHMRINKGVQIPEDSSLLLTSTSLLSTQYISIQPGGDDKVLAQGGVITNTQAANANDVMGLVGRFATGGATGGGNAPAPAPKPALPDSP